jgi:hypothetical protein
VSDGSLSEWLALREPADFAARSVALTKVIVDALARRGPVHDDQPVEILDLGTGTGSNIRYLAPRLGGRQRWLAVDHDAMLLAETAQRCAHIVPGMQLETRVLSLGALDGPEIFDGRQFVTASALLDLVSESWLQGVARQCRRVGADALFAINYSGRNACEPADPDDEWIFALFNGHQLTDKGIGGAAVGPHAADVTERLFGDAGYTVRREASDWHIGAHEREFQRQLIDGWAFAASEMAAERAAAIAAWTRRRLAHVDAGRSRIVVGHYDVACVRQTPGVGSSS